MNKIKFNIYYLQLKSAIYIRENWKVGETWTSRFLKQDPIIPVYIFPEFFNFFNFFHTQKYSILFPHWLLYSFKLSIIVYKLPNIHYYRLPKLFIYPTWTVIAIYSQHQQIPKSSLHISYFLAIIQRLKQLWNY